MGLETGTGIGDLVPANPLSTDAVSSGDDHLRLIKTVMQSITFMKSIQTFTASGTWTRPANVKKILIYCLGGGGGGGGAPVNGVAGGGGAGGGTGIKWLDVSAIASATVTVGVGGVGGALGSNVGLNGNATSFTTAGPVVQCLGSAGQAGTLSHTGGRALDPNANVGDIVFVGGDGTHGDVTPNPTAWGGVGGGSSGAHSNQSGHTNSGGGGGGAASTPSVGNAGGNGGSGLCVVFEFGW